MERVIALTHIGCEADISLAGQRGWIHVIMGAHHHALMPIIRSVPEWCSALVIWLVEIDIVPCEQ